VKRIKKHFEGIWLQSVFTENQIDYFPALVLIENPESAVILGVF
jgi:hypothetical protein